MGEAPLYFGRSDGWTFMHPNFEMFRSFLGIISPYATTMIMSGLFFSISSGWTTFSPNFSASILIGVGVIFLLFPSLSGWVITPKILKDLSAASATRDGTANSGVPKK